MYNMSQQKLHFGNRRRDRYNLKGEQDKQEIPLTYPESLDLADKDINENWDIYQERFLRGDFP